MIFEKTRKRNALNRIIRVIESSSIVRDAIYTVEAKYPKGQSPDNGEAVKLDKAARYIIQRLEILGLTVYRNDELMLDYLRYKIKAAHAGASMDKNSKYNEPETEPTNVYSGGSVTYR